jgi:aspartyl-tRNA(Asn)/glutamyl-tRNA(Gln) amidotransferase subunit C
MRRSWKDGKMSIERDVVEHVSRLAYINLTPPEVDEMATQLSSVLQHVSRLTEVDTDGVEPTSFALPASNVMRDDEPRPSWPPAAVLANAPVRHGDSFEVQAVLD